MFGVVVNNGVNAGFQTGLNAPNATIYNHATAGAIGGVVFNNGWNFGSQTGAYTPGAWISNY